MPTTEVGIRSHPRVEAEGVSDLDLVAYLLSTKYDAELRKNENYRAEMFEHLDVSEKLEDVCAISE